jgi:hypothetical protein
MKQNGPGVADFPEIGDKSLVRVFCPVPAISPGNIFRSWLRGLVHVVAVQDAFFGQ